MDIGVTEEEDDHGSWHRGFRCAGLDDDDDDVTVIHTGDILIALFLTLSGDGFVSSQSFSAANLSSGIRHG